ncbi:MAG: hypothetical protein L0H12_06455, partial [Nitrosospira sp.]|nr:hypothetical protein [Nitrosospira sp.]
AFDTAFPFIINPPAISPSQTLTRAAIVNGAFPKSPEQACINPHKPAKVRKADTRPRHAAPKTKKRKAVHHNSGRKRGKTVRRQSNDDDGWGNGLRGMDIIIGGGRDGFGRGHHRPHGRRGQRHR